MNEPISRELCSERVKHIQEKHEDLKEDVKSELKRHAEMIEEIHAQNARLTVIIERLTEIDERQDRELKHYRHQLEAAAEKQPWYETTVGVFAIKSAIFILLVIICAAIGLNAAETLKVVGK